MTDIVIEKAQLALESACGDAYEAAAILEAQAKEDQDLSNALLLPLLHTACYDAIRKICMKERGYIWKAAETKLRKDAVDNAERVRNHGRRLMDFILPMGLMRLGEAQSCDLQRSVEFYRKQARSELQRASWLELVAKEVGQDRKVKDALTEERLMELFRQAISGSE